MVAKLRAWGRCETMENYFVVKSFCLPHGPVWTTVISSSNWQAVCSNRHESRYVLRSDPHTGGRYTASGQATLHSDSCLVSTIEDWNWAYWTFDFNIACLWLKVYFPIQSSFNTNYHIYIYIRVYLVMSRFSFKLERKNLRNRTYHTLHDGPV